MVKAKGKTTGEDKAVEVGDDYLAARWMGVFSAVPSDGSDSLGEVRFEKSKGKWAIAYRFSEPGVEALGMYIAAGNASTSVTELVPEGDTSWCQWLESARQIEPGEESSEIQIEWGIHSGGVLVGGKATDGGWYVSPTWLGGIKQNGSIADTWIQTTTGSAKTMNTSGMLAFVQKSDWPGMAVASTQLGFDTRTREFREGLAAAREMRVVLPGQNPPLTVAADVWPMSETSAFCTMSTLKSVLFAGNRELGSGIEPENWVWPPQPHVCFRATYLSRVTGGFQITYSHMLYHVVAGVSQHIGFLRVVRDAAGLPRSQSWWVNQAIQVGFGQYAINPYLDLKIVPLSTDPAVTASIVLSAGDWFTTTNSRV